MLPPPRGASLIVSLPVRGAWIEMIKSPCSRPLETGRSPCGERGLKYHQRPGFADAVMSLPVRGAWIEIRPLLRHSFCNAGSLPVRGAWIEMSALRADVSK